MVAAAVLVVGALAIGSVAEVSARSGPYDEQVTTSYAALAAPLVNASTVTGARLAATLAAAPTPASSRSILQQGLDEAVADTSAQEAQVDALTPPGPPGSSTAQIAAVFEERERATANIRSTIYGMLGMAPQPIAGGTGPTAAEAATGPLLSTQEASVLLTNEGSLIQKADADLAAAAAALAAAPGHPTLPASVWVPPPTDTATLSAAQLGASAAALASAPGLAASHLLIVSSYGVSPPASPTGAAGTFGQGCTAAAAGTAPPPPAAATVLPPTSSLEVTVSSTNCGNVTETGVVFHAVLAPQVQPGGGARAVQTTVSSPVGSLAAGRSVSADLSGLTTVAGAVYVLTVSVTAASVPAPAPASSSQLIIAVTG